MPKDAPRLDGPARSVARGELVGLAVTIVASSDAGLVGQYGTVVDETLRTFTLERADGRVMRVGKRESTFEFMTARGPVRVVGAGVEFRSAERTKKVR
jgi:RNase P/RNase MRP subunit p29